MVADRARLAVAAGLLAAVSACSSTAGHVVSSSNRSHAGGGRAAVVSEPCVSGESPEEPHGPEGRESTTLRPLGRGVMGLTVRWIPPAQSPVSGRVGTWHLSGTLPAAPTGRGHVAIFYSPHPDDETLSMAPLITRAVASGIRVIVVAMTDGRTTSAIQAVNARLGRQARPSLTAQDIGTARIAELRRATAALGVSTADLVLAHLDAPSSDCGARVTVAEAHDVMALMTARYPGALQVTMSYSAERNLDHLACGYALRQLADSGAARHVEWTVSRLWWTLPTPPSHWVLPAGTAQRYRIEAAIAAYDLWDPQHLSYAIGAASVGPQFLAERIDPRARVHEH